MKTSGFRVGDKVKRLVDPPVDFVGRTNIVQGGVYTVEYHRGANLRLIEDTGKNNWWHKKFELMPKVDKEFENLWV